MTMSEPGVLRIWLEIGGDTVRFRWRQSEPNPFQDRNDFFIRYQDIDLAIFSHAVFWEIFLAFQLKVFAAYRRPVEVIFPEPIPTPSIAFWTAFHGADRVVCGPIADVERYRPLIRAPSTPARRRRAGVFFGGGKDSMSNAALMGEIYGANQVVLIQYIGPVRPGAEIARAKEFRQENLMLRPARENLGFATQQIWSDYQANFNPTGYHARPHVELYTAGSLPVLIERGVEVTSFGYARPDYPIILGGDGSRTYVYPESRPEFLAAQSAHYGRVLSLDHTLTNITFLTTHIMNFRLLHARYPQAFSQVIGCTDGGPNQPWCFRCGKCYLYAIYSLFTGAIDPLFDYDIAFTRSIDARRWVRYAESGVELSKYGNAPAHVDVMYPAVYMALCHMFANLDIGHLKSRISPDAMQNLFLFRALFGNRHYPSTQTLSTEVADFLGGPLARRVLAIEAEHFEVVDRLPGPVLFGNVETIIDYQTRMPLPPALGVH